MPDSLLPADFELNIVLLQSAPAELKDVADRYWACAGVDPYTQEVRWAHPTNQIGFEAWSGSAHYAAGAGATAVAPEFICSSCDGALVLTSRQALSDARRGRAVRCRACSPSFEQRAAAVLDPAAIQKRAQREERETVASAARAAQVEQERAQAAAQSAIDAQRAASLRDRYPAEVEDASEHDLVHSSAAARIGALAAIHVASAADGIVSQLSFVDASLAPDAELSRELFVDAWHSHLLLVHPSSPPEAFVWQSEEPAALGDGVFLEGARFMAPGAGPLLPRLQEFTSRLREYLQLESLWSAHRSELQELSRRLVAAETVRYFRWHLASSGLPDPSENHLEALRSHATRGATHFSLGQLYRMAWTSTRDAISAHAKHAGMGRPKAVVHAVNRFAHWVQRALDSPTDLGDHFNEDSLNVPLSAATDIAFRVILGVSPMRTTPLAISAILDELPDEERQRECDSTVPPRQEVIAWLRTSDWQPASFVEALQLVAGTDLAPCAPGCAHERAANVAYQATRVYDRIVARVGERDAALATAEATAIGNESNFSGRSGDLVIALVAEHLGWESDSIGVSA